LTIFTDDDEVAEDKNVWKEELTNKSTKRVITREEYMDEKQHRLVVLIKAVPKTLFLR
jgi:hypothetical protein